MGNSEDKIVCFYYLVVPYYEEENDVYRQTILNKINEIKNTQNP